MLAEAVLQLRFFFAPSGRFPHRGIKDFKELKFFEVEAVRHLKTCNVIFEREKKRAGSFLNSFLFFLYSP